MRYFVMEKISEQLYIKKLCARLYWSEEKLAQDLEELLSEKLLELISRGATLNYNKQLVKEFLLDLFVEKKSQNAFGWDSYNVLAMLDLVDKYGGEE